MSGMSYVIGGLNLRGQYVENFYGGDSGVVTDIEDAKIFGSPPGDIALKAAGHAFAEKGYFTIVKSIELSQLDFYLKGRRHIWEWMNLDLSEIHFRDKRPNPDSEEESLLVDRVFDFYREKGFPYVECDTKTLIEEFDRLQKTPSCLQMSEEGTTQVGQSMIGLTLANSYHPEMIEVPCRNFKTPLEVFKDDALLREAIRKRIRYGTNLKDWGIRKAIFSMRRTQRVSNFRPTAAKTIYEHFDPQLVVDFSMGWGGRLLAALACGVDYVGIDPNEIAVENNRQLYHDLCGHFDLPEAEMVTSCAEDILGSGRWKPDLIFTSPPYFDVEKYTDNPTQSYLRYPEEHIWYRDFLGRCISGAFADLAEGGHLVLNVNSDMGDRTVKLAKEAGFVLVAEWELLLSQHQYNKKTCGTYRYEPIFVFRKH